MNRRPFKEKEVAYLKKYAGIKTVKEMANRLNRSYLSIYKKLQRLDLETTQNTWSKKEIEYLIEKRKTKTIKEAAKELGRSIASVTAKSTRLNLCPDAVKNIRKEKERYAHFWSDQEVELLTSLTNSKRYTTPEIASFLERSEEGIRSKIKELKLPTPLPLNRHCYYSKSDEEKLVRMYKEGYKVIEIASEMNRSHRAIKGKLERMGYTSR